MSIEAEPVIKGENILGEGPLWISSTKQLVWTDIMENCVYSLESDSREVKRYGFETYLACLGEVNGGGVIAATGQGLLELNDSFEYIKYVKSIPFDETLVRFNDGKIGPDGAFWVGTMDLKAEKPVGALYRIGNSKSLENYKTNVHKAESDLTIPNGIGWSPDAKIMYLTDSKESVIYRYDFDKDSGSIKNKQIFVKDSERPGVPDGLAVDNQGNVWSARWGGEGVVCYDPGGKEKNFIILPVSNVTSCCFGGSDLEILYITTARFGINNPGELDGGLFVCQTGSRGQGLNKFGART